MQTIALPDPAGEARPVDIRPPADLAVQVHPSTSRMAFAACHVVADAMGAAQSVPAGTVDWDATLALRHRLWALGLGVAESMDTAQRGMGLGPIEAMELARRTMAEDPRHGAGVAVGVATDDITEPAPSLAEIADAYLRQIDVVGTGGGTPVVMASRHLARVAAGAADYTSVYERVLRSADRPVILHWLGPAFDPQLDGYWGTRDATVALARVSGLIAEHADKVVGIKMSLLEPALELELRKRLPPGVLLFTGDDFNYVDMIAGDRSGHSHALLGAFAMLAPYASAALARLDGGDERGFRAILSPTVELSRLVFEAPTQYYKVGIAWLSYLSGEQSHFRMIGGLESGRSLSHLISIVRAAADIGLFPDPELTVTRVNSFFGAQGVA